MENGGWGIDGGEKGGGGFEGEFLGVKGKEKRGELVFGDDIYSPKKNVSREKRNSSTKKTQARLGKNDQHSQAFSFFSSGPTGSGTFVFLFDVPHTDEVVGARGRRKSFGFCIFFFPQKLYLFTFFVFFIF